MFLLCSLSVLYKRCEANSIECPVKIGHFSLPYFKWNLGHKHIDLLSVDSKELVKDGMYHGKYRTNALDDVANTLLGYGKYKNYSGADFNSLPIDEAEKYSLQDSKLVIDLSKYNDFELLDAMQRICYCRHYYRQIYLKQYCDIFDEIWHTNGNSNCNDTNHSHP